MPPLSESGTSRRRTTMCVRVTRRKLMCTSSSSRALKLSLRFVPPRLFVHASGNLHVGSPVSCDVGICVSAFGVFHCDSLHASSGCCVLIPWRGARRV